MTNSADTGAAAPVSGAERIQALDITRGIAVLGILLMNVIVFGGPFQTFSDPFFWGPDTPNAPLETWFVIMTFFEGSQRTLFSILFGAGMILLASRMERGGRIGDTARILKRRNMWLIGFGLVDGYLFLWMGDILFLYGLVGLLLMRLRSLTNPKALMVAALCLIVLTGVRYMNYQGALDAKAAFDVVAVKEAAGDTVSDAEREAATAWPEVSAFYAMGKDSPAFKEQLKAKKGSYLDNFVQNAPWVLMFQTVVLVQQFFLDALAMMLIGMVLFRTGYLTLAVPARHYIWMLVAGYGIGIPLNFWEAWRIYADSFSAMSQISGAFTYDIGRLALAFGHLSLILLFCRTTWGTRVKSILAATGRMALTNYLMQSLLCGLIFYGFGLGLYGELRGYAIYSVVLVIWLLQLTWSPIWLGYFRFGPFEWLWRSLTYKTLQPMRRR